MIEWHRITPQAYATMHDLWTSLQSIFVEAFLPVVKSHAYAHDPKAASISVEKRLLKDQKVAATLSRSLRVEWEKKIEQFHAALCNPPFHASYVVFAKNSQRIIVGFALLKEAPIKNLLWARMITAQKGSSDLMNAVGDEISVELLAVKPDIQNKGVGKALLFAVFDECPHIKKIYLTTSASASNKKTQGFYEHVGFTRVFEGTLSGDDSESGFKQEKIVYLYQKS